METYETDWTREEFKAYLMLNCANADYIETDEEKELILSKVDNDYVRLQKIAQTAKRFGYTKDKADELLENMKQLFMQDHKFGAFEDYMYKGLKRILE